VVIDAGATGIRRRPISIRARTETPVVYAGLVDPASMVVAPPTVVGVIDGIEVDGEPSGPNDACRLSPVREADGDVVAGWVNVDECDDPGANTEVGVAVIVDEHAVTWSQRVPVKIQHHVARCLAGSRMRSHGSQSHHSGVLVGARVGSPGNICRQRQHRRCGTSLRVGSSSWPSGLTADSV
jgi:hypothetical protein